MKDSPSTSTSVVVLILFLPGLVASTLLYAWSLSTIWEWYLVGFCGLQTMSIKTAIGVSMIAGALSRFGWGLNRIEDKRTFYEKLGAAIGYMFAAPVAAVAIAWLWLQALS